MESEILELIQSLTDMFIRKRFNIINIGADYVFFRYEPEPMTVVRKRAITFNHLDKKTIMKYVYVFSHNNPLVKDMLIRHH